MFEILEADIVIMQETKIQRKDLRDDMVLVPGWDVFFSLPKHKKGQRLPSKYHTSKTANYSILGYSGVAIYTRNAICAPIRAEEGVTGILCPPKSATKYRDLPHGQQIGGYPRPGQLDGAVDETTIDCEGRCVILEFPAFVLFGVYSPANRDESRDEFRVGFFQALDVRIRNLIAEGKQVILAGDLNVIRSEIDSTNVAETLRKEGMDIKEWMNLPARRIFNHLLYEGNVVGIRDEGREKCVLWDICRCFHPGRQGMNTCWDTKRNTRPANNGSRIDYILCSDGIKSWFDAANIQEGLMGSDHCPVFATLSDKVQVGGKEQDLSELLNPPGTFQNQQRTREWGPSDLLPLSARLIPEFDRRQSIRDMFTKKAVPSFSQQPSRVAETLLGETNADAYANGDSGTSQKNSEFFDSQTEINSQLSGTAVDRSGSSLFKQQTIPKRPSEPTESTTNRSFKRSRPTAGTTDGKGKVAPGQMTLQGFFKPKATESRPGKSGKGMSSSENLPRSPAKPNSPQQKARPPVTSSEHSPNNTTSNDSDKVFDPIQAKESWSKLLSKRVAPRCEHNEPCISLVTKKPGVNCGKPTHLHKRTRMCICICSSFHPVCHRLTSPSLHSLVSLIAYLSRGLI